MAATEQMTDEQLDQRVMEILSRELTLSELVHYLRLHRVGTGDYTKDRHQWLDHLTVEDVLLQMENEEANLPQ